MSLNEQLWIDRCHQYSMIDGESGFQVNFAGMNFKVRNFIEGIIMALICGLISVFVLYQITKDLKFLKCQCYFFPVCICLM